MVTQARKLLEDALYERLEGRFGIHCEGAIEELSRMRHLDMFEAAYRMELLAHLQHLQAAGFSRSDALAQLVREIAFTHLNRLCAYKMCEERKLIRESVSRGINSRGFKFYLADHPADEHLWKEGHQDEAYRNFLVWLGGTLSSEIGILFSTDDPASHLFPPHHVLEKLLELINSESLNGIWKEDETIGWIYQYFTPKELRDQARKESQAPRNSYELAFRNQFFTPRYVVEFLVDNTLGRIWYEMCSGFSAIADRCKYMVRRPDEVFLAKMDDNTKDTFDLFKAERCGSIAPYTAREKDRHRLFMLAHCVNAYHRGHSLYEDKTKEWSGALREKILADGSLDSLKTQELMDLLFITARADRCNEGFFDSEINIMVKAAEEVRKRAFKACKEELSQEEMLKLPHFIEYRPLKDPRDLKILDPACGSGHFLLYCFDLLMQIYQEAYERESAPSFTGTGKALKDDYPDREAFLREIPGMILRYNLHGIDIDLRATQIASLALWLRAQRAYQEMELKGDDRPSITKSNIVCAEPMPGEEEMLEEFVSPLEPKILGHFVRQIFNKMKLAGEAGSLLKIEEELAEEIKKTKKEWSRAFTPAVMDKRGQLSLFTEAELDEIDDIKSKQMTIFDLSDVHDEDFWNRAEEQVLEALRRYAEESSNGPSCQKRLFAEDAARGFAFIDVLRKRYDVVVMNPPFGEPSKGAKDYIVAKFPESKSDLACAFVERWLAKCVMRGNLGAITTRTPFFLSSYTDWRKDVILKEGALSVFADFGGGVLDAMVETAAYCLSNAADRSPSLFLRMIREEDKGTALKDAIDNHFDKKRFTVPSSSFSMIPNSPLSYWVGERIRRLFVELPAFEGEGRTVKAGLCTGDDFRFVRLWWEVQRKEEARSRQDTISGKRWVPFAKGGSFSPFYYDIHLVVNWDEDGDHIRTNIQPGTRVQNTEYYFRPGLTWPLRTTSGIGFRAFPKGSIFGHKGPCAFISDPEITLSILNSSSFESLLKLQLSAADAAARSYEVGLIQKVPFPESLPAELGHYSESCIQLTRSLDTVNETSHVFLFPALIRNQRHNLKERLIGWAEEQERARTGIKEAQEAIDDLAFDLYGISEEDRKMILSDDVSMKSDTDEGSEGDEKSPTRDEDSEYDAAPQDGGALTQALISWCVGTAVGLWDVRLATGERPIPALPDPFDPLPIYSPGMLQEIPADYPIVIDADGILVDDEAHSDDIVRRVRDVLALLWKEQAGDIEKEACEILGVKGLREYFAKPGKGGFFDDHIKRYSKSRRKAPIYWFLQSSKKNYSLWLYYHRLDKDMLFKALENYVRPKIQREENRLSELRQKKAALGDSGGKEAKNLDKDIERGDAFLSELIDFREKLERAAKLYLVPDLNDGVVLNIAPLWELVPWSEAKKYWDELVKGSYEWSSIGKQLREKGLVKEKQRR